METPRESPDGTADQTPPPPVVHELKRKPRIFLGTFWLVVTVLLAWAGFANIASAWWCILIAIATFAYSIYLYRGGRFGFWFI